MKKAQVGKVGHMEIGKRSSGLRDNLFYCLKWGQLPCLEELQPFFQLYLGAHLLKSMKIFNVYIVGKFEFKESR